MLTKRLIVAAHERLNAAECFGAAVPQLGNIKAWSEPIHTETYQMGLRSEMDAGLKARRIERLLRLVGYRLPSCRVLSGD